MRRLGYLPAWSHRGRMNMISLVLNDRKKRSTAFLTISAVLLAALVGMLGLRFPETLRRDICDILLAPLADGFLGLLRTFSGVMILLSLCSGITGLGDSKTLGRLTGALLRRVLLLSVVAGFVTIALIRPLVRLSSSVSMQMDTGAIKEISQMFFDILPPNLIEPFQTGNILQILTIALLLGMALLAMRERGSTICRLIDEGAILSQNVIAVVCSAIPLYVFAVFLQQIWLGDAQTLLLAWKPLVLINLFMVVATIVFWMASAMKLRYSPVKLIKKVMPPCLIAFTTASSLSAVTLSMETCENKLGIKKKMVSYLFPLEFMLYRITNIVYYLVLVFCLAEMYGVEVGLPWMLMAMILVMLMAVASPPINGGGMMVYSILITSLGIPANAIILAVGIEVLSDFMYTGCTIFMQILHVACEAERLGALDRKILTDDSD
jgi:Na+/H+-dicarboxylate symporter